MQCPDCGADLTDVPVDDSCPNCGDRRRSATVEAGAAMVSVSAMRADVEVRYGEPGWVRRWNDVTKSLRQLRAMFGADSPIGNDLIEKEIDYFFLECWHMKDSLEQDATAPRVIGPKLWAFVNGQLPLRITEGYANTHKHIFRDGKAPSGAPPQITARRSRFYTSRAGVHCEIEYWSDDIQPTPIDALDLAEQAYAAWKAFLAQRGLAEPDWICDILDS